MSKIGGASRRVNVDGALGMVRWEGVIADRKGRDQQWYGIEWDDPERGKHDGQHKGMRYFSCLNVNAGEKSASFVRPEKVSFGISLLAALQEKYGDTSNVDSSNNLSLSSTTQKEIAVQFVRKEHLDVKKEDLSSLQLATLRTSQVSSVGPWGSTSMRTHAPQLREVDLAESMLSKWEDVFSLLNQCQHLHSVNLRANAMGSLSEAINNLNVLGHALGDAMYPNLRLIVLSDTGLSWSDTVLFACISGQLKEIHVADNNITSLSLPPEDVLYLPGSSEGMVEALKEVEVLNLSGNGLDWPGACALGPLPMLKNLILTGNNIATVYCPQVAGRDLFARLESLSLNENEIKDWESVNELNRFPALIDVRMADNPISQAGSDTGERTISYYMPGPARHKVIAMIGKLKRYGGGEVKARERADAERDYLKGCALELLSDPMWQAPATNISAGSDAGEARSDSAIVITHPSESFLKRHPRYLGLIEEHGVPSVGKGSVIGGPGQHNTLADEVLQLRVVCNAPEAKTHEPMNQRVPRSMQIASLRSLCSRYFGIGSENLVLYYRDKTMSFPELLDNPLARVSDYGMTETGEVMVEYS